MARTTSRRHASATGLWTVRALFIADEEGVAYIDLAGRSRRPLLWVLISYCYWFFYQVSTTLRILIHSYSRVRAAMYVQTPRKTAVG